MSMDDYSIGPTKMTLGGGTCIKLGFCFAFGAFLFTVLLSVLAGIAAVILGALGVGVGLFSGMLPRS